MGTVLNIQSFILGNFVKNFIESSHTNPEVQCALSLVYYCEVWHLFTILDHCILAQMRTSCHQWNPYTHVYDIDLNHPMDTIKWKLKYSNGKYFTIILDRHFKKVDNLTSKAILLPFRHTGKCCYIAL